MKRKILTQHFYFSEKVKKWVAWKRNYVEWSKSEADLNLSSLCDLGIRGAVRGSEGGLLLVLHRNITANVCSVNHIVDYIVHARDDKNWLCDSGKVKLSWWQINPKNCPATLSAHNLKPSCFLMWSNLPNFVAAAAVFARHFLYFFPLF